MAIISTGANFPDALSAGPAAASQDAPVILVNGSASSIDSETEDLLVDLGISRVYIAGGTKSVSPGIEASLKALLGSSNVVRFAGADRFEVGVLISQEFFGSAEFTFVATGYKFPDALTGGPLAAAYGGPLYLSRPECLPAGVAFDVLDLDAQAIILLGGPASLSPAVENLQLC
jgi:putative cell wall-binding protein